MVQQIQVGNIIDYLVGLGTVSSQIGDRMFWGSPSNEDQDGIYATVNTISETNTIVSKGTRLEFRLIANNDDVNYSDLYSIRSIITDALVVECNTIDMGGFLVYGVEETGTVVNSIDDKGRKILLFDYRFYFTN